MSATVKVDEAGFGPSVLESEKPVLVDFWAEWCGPCKMIAPILEEIAQERPELSVAKVDIDANPGLARDFQIMSIPTLMLFKNGEVVHTISGARSKANLLGELEGKL